MWVIFPEYTFVVVKVNSFAAAVNRILSSFNQRWFSEGIKWWSYGKYPTVGRKGDNRFPFLEQIGPARFDHICRRKLLLCLRNGRPSAFKRRTPAILKTIIVIFFVKYFEDKNGQQIILISNVVPAGPYVLSILLFTHAYLSTFILSVGPMLLLLKSVNPGDVAQKNCKFCAW